MRLKTIDKVHVRGKHVLVRTDFNVFTERERIRDDFRIRRTIPTLRHLLKQRAKVIIATHFGRPLAEARDESDMARFSTRKIARQLAKDLGKKVSFVSACTGPKVARAAAQMRAGEILMLENLRFHPEEEANDQKFARDLASCAAVYVNEAFSVCHRAHASVEAITRFVPSYAGLLLAEEVRVLHGAYHKPKLPLVIVMGGAKIETKAKLIKRFFDKADNILLGGIIANFVLKVKGIAIGKSVVSEEASGWLRELNWTSSKLHLPVDVVVAREVSEHTKTATVGVGNVGDDEMILDIGRDTCELFSHITERAGTIIWNGPMGFFELSPFADGTIALAKAMARSRAFTIAGGGDSVVVLNELGLSDNINFMSTGGGAMLDFLADEPMPGIEALQRKNGTH
ncbi:MAG: phosphoglycerate kinase [Patescibacteria group bacterium]